MAETVSSLLRRSLEHLASEVPDSHRRLRAALGTMEIGLDVDGEQFSLRGGQRLEVADGPSGTADVQVRTTRAAILDILDAKVGLSEAVRADRVQVRGTLEQMLAAYDALMAYGHAAVRAPSLPGLLAVLRTGGAR